MSCIVILIFTCSLDYLSLYLFIFDFILLPLSTFQIHTFYSIYNSLSISIALPLLLLIYVSLSLSVKILLSLSVFLSFSLSIFYSLSTSFSLFLCLSHSHSLTHSLSIYLHLNFSCSFLFFRRCTPSHCKHHWR